MGHAIGIPIIQHASFPDPETANEIGILCQGGSLREDYLLEAYRIGVFPFFSRGGPILWWSPDPRMVLFPDEFHCSRRLARRLRQPCYRHSMNEAFPQVIRSCAHIGARNESRHAWLLPEMIDAYTRLHRLGWAHSFEVWREGELVGGLYGVLRRRVFFAESMFSRLRDGSKMAMARMVEHAKRQGWKLIDCQFHTAHLASLGAREISRRQFLHMLGAKS